jgi:hypothetical protein
VLVISFDDEGEMLFEFEEAQSIHLLYDEKIM